MTPFDPLHIVCFDIETRASTQEVGGWDALRQGKGGISALVTWDSETQDYHFFDDHTIADFAHCVEQPGTVLVGFNSKWFDLPCVEGVLGRRLAVKYHIDLFSYIKDALDREGRTRERGWKLGDASLRSMGITKSGSGASAPDLAREHRYAELFTYCKHDVVLTQQLLDYIRRHGGVADRDGSLLELDIPKWLRLPAQSALEG
jgi:hypothetical protein